MVGMPEIDILDVGMGDKLLALVCWNLMFSMLLCWKIIYIFFRTIAGKYTVLRKNAGKTFTKSYNNPGILLIPAF